MLGGAVIGLAAAVLLATLGRIAGVSGIIGGLLPPPRYDTKFEVTWRAAFVLGLLMSGWIAYVATPGSPIGSSPASTTSLAVGGLLVGFGTRLGNGCTSGHGVCGVSRGSARSLVATTAFIVAGMTTVAVASIVGGES